MIINSIFACTPIAELFLLFGWPLLSLFGVVLIKLIWFTIIATNRGFSAVKSFLAMLLGNIVSTLIGFIPFIILSAPLLIFVSPLLIMVVSDGPAQRLHKFSPWKIFQKISPSFITVAMGLLFPLSCLLFFTSQNILAEQEMTIYWLTKLIYVYFGLAITFFLTALWEEKVVGEILQSSFVPEMLKMNLYIMATIWLTFAIFALPQRLNAPNFLLYGFQTLSFFSYST